MEDVMMSERVGRRLRRFQRGFVQSAEVENLDFCNGQVMWPPVSAVQVTAAEPRTCQQVCQEEQVICEPSVFQHLNKDQARFGVDCHTVELSVDTVVPAYSETRRHCIFHSDLLLFSCAASAPAAKHEGPGGAVQRVPIALTH